ncbi:MAG: protocatechuate 3,4-dioxygenase [Novosphingobium sp.]|jgi:hypothetical protein|nr:protocatechuate 3,4-dioxygenase [Novosphingobium sp.]
MADLVFAFATSHGPQLSMPPETWELRSDVDRTRRHDYRGEVYSFDTLMTLRRSDTLVAGNQQAQRTAHYARSQAALDTLEARLAEAAPDVLIVIGDDQHEWFTDANQPALSVLFAPEVVNRRFDASEFTPGSGLDLAAPGWRPAQDQAYAVDQSLARAIIAQAIEDEFDISTCGSSPVGPDGPLCITHSVGFVVRRLMRDKPVPLVPVLQNTFWAPNQIKPGRAYDFGRSIARAIKGWGGENAGKRVAVCASGGLSHYVVDEEWDRRMLAAMLANDEAAMRNEPNAMFQSGTSETKNWFTLCGIAAEFGLEMALIDYVPCYRTEAGTGNAMGFAVWE